MELSGSATRRRQRTQLGLAAVIVGTVAAIGLTAPAAVRDALDGRDAPVATTATLRTGDALATAATTPGIAASVCLSMQEDQWICNGTPQAPAPPRAFPFG